MCCFARGCLRHRTICLFDNSDLRYGGRVVRNAGDVFATLCKPKSISRAQKIVTSLVSLMHSQIPTLSLRFGGRGIPYCVEVVWATLLSCFQGMHLVDVLIMCIRICSDLSIPNIYQQQLVGFTMTSEGNDLAVTIGLYDIVTADAVTLTSFDAAHTPSLANIKQN